MSDSRAENRELFPCGTLSIGCNYWASHAGIRMWRDWDADIVRADLKLLADAGITVLRIFPLWPDFQPVSSLLGSGSRVRDTAMTVPGDVCEAPLGAIDSGVDPVMLTRLREFADIAAENNIRLIIALVTGWMSGRLFVPPALVNLDPITDPAALRWEVKLVRAIVDNLKDHSAVAAWDLGNECNVMGKADPDSSWTWTALISDAIRSRDPRRPIVSGMHGLSTDPHETWSIHGQAESTDVLTTHPYPLFTPHCGREVLASFRPILHAAAETRLYGDLGGVEAFAEETGSLGPAVASDEAAASYARAAALSLWVYDCRAIMWWCAFDFIHLEYPPYEWDSVERELGLFSRRGPAGSGEVPIPKPPVAALASAYACTQSIDEPALPPRAIDAVCVLPSRGDWWGVAYSVFLLSLQAGFDVAFVTDRDPLPESKLYLLPSMRFSGPHSGSTWRELCRRVEAGATLYASMDDGILTGIEAVFGVRITGRYERSDDRERTFEEPVWKTVYQTRGKTGYRTEPVRADVLASMANGDPAFTVAEYGKGRAFLLTFPVEHDAATTPSFFSADGSCDLYRLYETISRDARRDRVVMKTSPFIGVTEHPVTDTERIVVFINYTETTIHESISLASGWAPVVKSDARVSGDREDLRIEVEPFDAALVRVRRDGKGMDLS